MKESAIGKAFRDWCRKQDYLVIKLTTLGLYGEAGWPDYLVLPGGGRVIFVEMKRPGEEPTKLQRHRHEELERKGYIVLVARSPEEARASTLRAASVSGGRHALHGDASGSGASS
jgi:hypothetical protein